MKILITGSRTATDYPTLKLAIETAAAFAALNLANYVETMKPELILHGGAKGADQLAQRYADAHNLPTEVLRPDYKKYYHKVAPLHRNTELVAKADIVIAYYATNRKRKGGTWDTAQKAIIVGKPLLEITEGARWANWILPQLELF